MANNLYVIIGPTCSKKSNLVNQIYSKLGYPIINCDIYKAYKYSDFWVNQICKTNLNNPKFYLYSFINPHENMNVAMYQKIARDCISKLLKQASVILVGGSCLYMNSIVFKEYIFGNIKRQKPKLFTNFFPNTIFIGLNWNRQTLYKNIDTRVDNLAKLNLDIPKFIYDYYRNSLLAKAIGYKEWFPYFEKKINYNQALCIIKQNTRNYAKRQLTWYRNQYNNVFWYSLTNENFNYIFDKIIKRVS